MNANAKVDVIIINARINASVIEVANENAMASIDVVANARVNADANAIVNLNADKM